MSEHALPIAIQHASLKDLEALCKIEKGCFTEEAFSKEQIAHFLKASAAINLVAQVNGKTAGFILGLIEHHRKSYVGHVYTIDVASKYRRMRVGLKLLEAIEEISEREALKHVFSKYASTTQPHVNFTEKTATQNSES